MIFLYVYLAGFLVFGYWAARDMWRDGGEPGETFGLSLVMGSFWPVLMPLFGICEACDWVAHRKLHIKLMNWTLGPRGTKRK